MVKTIQERSDKDLKDKIENLKSGIYELRENARHGYFNSKEFKRIVREMQEISNYTFKGSLDALTDDVAKAKTTSEFESGLRAATPQLRILDLLAPIAYDCFSAIDKKDARGINDAEMRLALYGEEKTDSMTLLQRLNNIGPWFKNPPLIMVDKDNNLLSKKFRGFQIEIAAGDRPQIRKQLEEKNKEYTKYKRDSVGDENAARAAKQKIAEILSTSFDNKEDFINYLVTCSSEFVNNVGKYANPGTKEFAPILRAMGISEYVMTTDIEVLARLCLRPLLLENIEGTTLPYKIEGGNMKFMADQLDCIVLSEEKLNKALSAHMRDIPSRIMRGIPSRISGAGRWAWSGIRRICTTVRNLEDDKQAEQVVSDEMRNELLKAGDSLFPTLDAMVFAPSWDAFDLDKKEAAKLVVTKNPDLLALSNLKHIFTYADDIKDPTLLDKVIAWVPKYGETKKIEIELHDHIVSLSNPLGVLEILANEKYTTQLLGLRGPDGHVKVQAALQWYGTRDMEVQSILQRTDVELQQKQIAADDQIRRLKKFSSLFPEGDVEANKVIARVRELSNGLHKSESGEFQVPERSALETLRGYRHVKSGEGKKILEDLRGLNKGLKAACQELGINYNDLFSTFLEFAPKGKGEQLQPADLLKRRKILMELIKDDKVIPNDLLTEEERKALVKRLRR